METQKKTFHYSVECWIFSQFRNGIPILRRSFIKIQLIVVEWAVINRWSTHYPVDKNDV